MGHMAGRGGRVSSEHLQGFDKWFRTKPEWPVAGRTKASFAPHDRRYRFTPLAQNTNGRRSAIDGRTTRHSGYAVSQRIRKRIEEAFGWMKSVAGQRKARFRGVERVGWSFAFTATAYNLVRLPKLLTAPA